MVVKKKKHQVLNSQEIELVSEFYALHRKGFKKGDIPKAKALLDEIESQGLESKLTINMIRELNAKAKRHGF